MKTQNINEKIKLALFSADVEVVKQAIEKISIDGNSLYLPLLFDLLNTFPEHEIELEITNLLGTVKDKQSVNSFMRAIENEKYKRIRKTLISACWQNGLDFSNFIPVFVDIIIHDEWEVAFESFTVIDNLEYLPSPEIVSISRQKIEAALPSAASQVNYFLTRIMEKLNGEDFQSLT
jgi:hypothetical protein